MKPETLQKFEDYLHSFERKNGKKLGERTKYGVLTLAKFLEETPHNASLTALKKIHSSYIKQRSYPLAVYTLWMYLSFLGYEENKIKEIIAFKRNSHSATTDDEKLAASVLNKKELFYLVDHIENKRDNLIIRFLYDTAARVSEMANLKLKDIDADTGEVHVLGKGKKPRTVFIQETTIKLLKEYLQEKNIQAPNELVFTIKPMSIWYNLKRYGKDLLGRDLHPHMFRHTRLQHMADEGVDSFAIKSYAGHSDIATTQIYVKNSKFQRKLAFNKAGNIWLDDPKRI
ncbi:tyrosine-type recombinase/integrase [Candidatus Woesearchaeota archaeon]|nr:tyrosine-type recombinase/integrase [Candidatus Woesearchaeota archaeon]